VHKNADKERRHDDDDDDDDWWMHMDITPLLTTAR
jgi:hypothetical protein